MSTTIPDGDAGSALHLGRLEALLGFHLRMASAAVARDFASAMQGLDLTQKQYAVLELIDANPGVSQIDLATTLGTDRATMMAIVDRLDARQFLTRRRSASDGRRQALHLTAAGARTLVAARNRIVAHEQRFIATLGDRGDHLIAMLREIYAISS